MHADKAPRVTVHIGQQISVRSVTDAQGSPTEQPPALAPDRALRVVRTNRAHGVLVLQAAAAGRSVLVAHSKLCVSATGASATSCPVLRVTVTP